MSDKVILSSKAHWGRDPRLREDSVIRIRFTDVDAKKRALGRLAGRFPFKSWATGEMLVPEGALGFLATENIAFQVEGPATYEQITPSLRDPASAPVQ